MDECQHPMLGRRKDERPSQNTTLSPASVCGDSPHLASSSRRKLQDDCSLQLPMPPRQLSRSAKKKRNSCPRSSISSTADRARRETRGPQTQTRERFGFEMLEMVGPCAMPLADDAGTWLYQSDLRHQKVRNEQRFGRSSYQNWKSLDGEREGGQPGAEFILSQGATWPSIQSDASM